MMMCLYVYDEVIMYDTIKVCLDLVGYTHIDCCVGHIPRIEMWQLYKKLPHNEIKFQNVYVSSH